MYNSVIDHPNSISCDAIWLDYSCIISINIITNYSVYYIKLECHVFSRLMNSLQRGFTTSNGSLLVRSRSNSDLCAIRLWFHAVFRKLYRKKYIFSVYCLRYLFWLRLNARPHADKYPYPHDRRADKDSYPHDRYVSDDLCSLIKLFCIYYG